MLTYKSSCLWKVSSIFITLLLYGCEAEIKNGKQAFQRCTSCHSMKPGINFTGPSLAGILNRKAGTAIGFSYSPAVKSSGVVWTAENLDAWLTNPQAFIPGTKMKFEGIPNQKAREELIAILRVKTALPSREQ